MKKVFILCVLLVAAAGCQNEQENAPANMKKGNSFYEVKEYDVAQYYYEKIPPESPLYPDAKNKLDSIAIFKKYWAITKVTDEDMKKIDLIDHSGSMNLSSMKPLHSFVILNNTERTLSIVTVEFTYYDFEHNVVGKLTCDVDAPVPSMKKGVFSRVEPGILKSAFARSTVKLVGAQY
jgi:hypothetical protein